MSLLPSCHFRYLSPHVLYLSILPTHNLFHYISPSPPNSLNCSLPFCYLCLSFFLFLSISLPLILHLGVRMLSCRFQLKSQTLPQILYNSCGSDPALSGGMWSQSGTCGSGLLVMCVHYSVRAMLPGCISWFVCLSSYVLYCNASLSAPEDAFWDPLAMTVLTLAIRQT